MLGVGLGSTRTDGDHNHNELLVKSRSRSEQAKSDGYKRSRSTRVFAIAASPDESGEDALDWLMNELAEDGDEIVAIRVLELDDEGELSC